MRVLPRSLAGYLIAATVLATVLTQTLITVALMVYQDSKFDKYEDLYFYQKIVSTADYLNNSEASAACPHSGDGEQRRNHLCNCEGAARGSALGSFS